MLLYSCIIVELQTFEDQKVQFCGSFVGLLKIECSGDRKFTYQ